jgi:dolichol-phosphate mannosyltransferase
MDKLTISIVVPCCNEEANVPKLIEELERVLSAGDWSWEIIFVDDGSSDSTWNQISSFNSKFPRIKGVRLSRNFGHQYALFAGLSSAQGDAVITMDADLQHPPDLIPKLVFEWEKGYKIVNTIRMENENVSVFKKTSSRIFYKMFTIFSGIRIDPGMADFRLLDREVIKKILDFREESLFIRGLVQWVGFPNSTVEYQPLSRFSGKSKYSIRKMVRFAIDGISSFSIIPLRIAIVIGFLTSFFSFLGIIYAVYSKFAYYTVPGWSSTLAVISFLLGILFILLGIIGEYIGRILIEVKRRPRYIISERVGIDTSQPTFED